MPCSTTSFSIVVVRAPAVTAFTNSWRVCGTWMAAMGWTAATSRTSPTVWGVRFMGDQYDARGGRRPVPRRDSPTAVGYLVREKHRAADVEAARDEAISFAAYRLLKYRFPVGYLDADGKPCHPNDATSQAAFDARMDALGYDRTFTSTDGDSPA